MRRVVVMAACLLLAAPSGRAAAPSPSATPEAAREHREASRRFFESGQLLFDRGNFVEAAHQFELAYEEEPAPAFLYNIATAYEKGGDRDKAAAAYRKYGAAAPAAKDRAAALTRAGVLEKEAHELAAARSGKAPPAKGPPVLPYAEPQTKHVFMTGVTLDGQPYTLLGAGLRKVFTVKVYAMGLYVEDEPARARFPRLAGQAGGADRDSLMRSMLGFQFVVRGEFGKAALLHFVRDTSAKESRDGYRSVLDDLGNKAEVEAFLNLFEDMKSGEDLWIRTTSTGQITVEAHGKRRMGPTSLALEQAIWDIWLGPKPISEDLKKGLIERLDTLGR